MRALRLGILIVGLWLAITALILLILDQTAPRSPEEGVLEYCAGGYCVYRQPNGERVVQ